MTNKVSYNTDNSNACFNEQFFPLYTNNISVKTRECFTLIAMRERSILLEVPEPNLPQESPIT